MSSGSVISFLQKRKSNKDSDLQAHKLAGRRVIDLHFIMTRSSSSESLPMSTGSATNETHFSNDNSTRLVHLVIDSGNVTIDLHSRR